MAAGIPIRHPFRDSRRRRFRRPLPSPASPNRTGRFHPVPPFGREQPEPTRSRYSGPIVACSRADISWATSLGTQGSKPHGSVAIAPAQSSVLAAHRHGPSPWPPIARPHSPPRSAASHSPAGGWAPRLGDGLRWSRDRTSSRPHALVAFDERGAKSTCDVLTATCDVDGVAQQGPGAARLAEGHEPIVYADAYVEGRPLGRSERRRRVHQCHAAPNGLERVAGSGRIVPEDCHEAVPEVVVDHAACALTRRPVQAWNSPSLAITSSGRRRFDILLDPTTSANRIAAGLTLAEPIVRVLLRTLRG